MTLSVCRLPPRYIVIITPSSADTSSNAKGAKVGCRRSLRKVQTLNNCSIFWVLYIVSIYIYFFETLFINDCTSRQRLVVRNKNNFTIRELNRLAPGRPLSAGKNTSYFPSRPRSADSRQFEVGSLKYFS